MSGIPIDKSLSEWEGDTETMRLHTGNLVVRPKHCLLVMSGTQPPSSPLMHSLGDSDTAKPAKALKALLVPLSLPLVLRGHAGMPLGERSGSTSLVFFTGSPVLTHWYARAAQVAALAMCMLTAIAVVCPWVFGNGVNDRYAGTTTNPFGGSTAALWLQWFLTTITDNIFTTVFCSAVLLMTALYLEEDLPIVSRAHSFFFVLIRTIAVVQTRARIDMASATATPSSLSGNATSFAEWYALIVCVAGYAVWLLVAADTAMAVGVLWRLSSPKRTSELEVESPLDRVEVDCISHA